MVGKLQEENTKQVYVVMQNNKPIVKFHNEQEANQTAQELQKKFPEKKVTVVSKPAVKQMYEGEVVKLKFSTPNKPQYGTRVFPPKQRKVEKPEGNVTPIRSKLKENNADYHTAAELAQEMYQDIQDLMAITQSGSKIAAGNPHNVESLRNSIQELDQEIANLGYHYDPLAQDLIKPIKG